jgi:hypothetical protein
VPLDPVWPFFSRLPGQGCCPGDEPRVGRVVSVCGLQVGRVESSRVQSWVESHRVVEKESSTTVTLLEKPPPVWRHVACSAGVCVCVRALVGVLLETNVVLFRVEECPNKMRALRLEPETWIRLCLPRQLCDRDGRDDPSYWVLGIALCQGACPM